MKRRRVMSFSLEGVGLVEATAGSPFGDDRQEEQEQMQMQQQRQQQIPFGDDKPEMQMQKQRQRQQQIPFGDDQPEKQMQKQRQRQQQIPFGDDKQEKQKRNAGILRSAQNDGFPIFERAFLFFERLMRGQLEVGWVALREALDVGWLELGIMMDWLPWW